MCFFFRKYRGVFLVSFRKGSFSLDIGFCQFSGYGGFSYAWNELFPLPSEFWDKLFFPSNHPDKVFIWEFGYFLFVFIGEHFVVGWSGVVGSLCDPCFVVEGLGLTRFPWDGHCLGDPIDSGIDFLQPR